MNFFDIYIRKTGNFPDIEVFTIVDIRDFISSATKVENLMPKAQLKVDPAMTVKVSDGNSESDFYIGDCISISFRSSEVTQQEITFLKAIAEGKIDVIFWDPVRSDVIYGVKDIIVDAEPVSVDEQRMIHVAGERTGFENYIFYNVVPYGVFIRFPRNGYIYNRSITDVMGIAQ